jgi:hypothetical protein
MVGVRSRPRRANRFAINSDVRNEGNNTMLDVIFIAATVLFFAAGILYVRACERLK